MAKMSIDQIIDLIRTIVTSAAPEAILAVVAPFLPKPVAAVLTWAVSHKDCLDELLEALRGSFSGDASETNLPLDAIAECRSACVDG